MRSAIVVGAGVFGGSLALRLVSSGWEVTLVEQYPPGHVRAASGGESRLIRCSHGSAAWYTRSASSEKSTASPSNAMRSSSVSLRNTLGKIVAAA